MSVNKKTFISAADIEDVFSGFKNDKERIKYMNEYYSGIDLAKSFEIFYDMKVSPEAKKAKVVNTNIVIGNIY